MWVSRAGHRRDRPGGHERGIDALMVISEQLTDDRRHVAATLHEEPWAAAGAAAERAARSALRAQVARLERELSVIVAARFPHVAALPDPVGLAEGDGAQDVAAGHASSDSAATGVPRGPHLLTLGELERLRDSLALRIREAQGYTRRRDELERLSRELLERMKAEPGRYKFVRLPVTDLGERGCGVWEVRPRLGLIGMLAGWWQLKLSSGCPLPRGPRATRGPGPEASPEQQSGLALATPVREHRGERAALALGHRPDGLGFRHRDQREELARAVLTPSTLAG
jgi:hypothetical protein